MRGLLLLFSRWRVIGRDNVPSRGPLIVVANHFSFIDPPLISASVSRRISFLAKQELFRFLPIKLMISSFGAIPVRRGRSSRYALERCQKLLGRGQTLGIFPENRRSRNGQLQHPQRGVAVLAVRTGAPILPIAIMGSEKVQRARDIFRRPSITVVVGRPFHLEPPDEESAEALQAQAELVMGRIASLLPESHRGPFAQQVAAEPVGNKA